MEERGAAVGVGAHGGGVDDGVVVVEVASVEELDVGVAEFAAWGEVAGDGVEEGVGGGVFG